MSRDIIYPKFRYPIEVRLEKIEAEEIILISCPAGISKNPLALIPAVGPVIACFEGQLSVNDILKKFENSGLTPDILDTLIKLLDENLFLATPRFFEAQSALHSEFKNSSVRPAALAGRAYSNNGETLKTELESYLNHEGVFRGSSEKLCGLVSPHIDYRRGHITYGKTYSRIKNQDATLYVLIGTSHQFGKNTFHLSAKSFGSPLGTLECDVHFVRKLAGLYGDKRSFEEEILHRKEHSLELQVPFLKHLNSSSKIVPILVGSFHHMLEGGKPPQSYEEYDKFADSLAACLKEHSKEGGSFCFVCGVDMAHVGRHFGDKKELTQVTMEKVEERDKIYLECILKQDKTSMFAHIAEDMDERRICGFPTMYTVIDCFDRLGIKYKSELYEYRQAVDYKTDCAVTFAGVGLYF